MCLIMFHHRLSYEFFSLESAVIVPVILLPIIAADALELEPAQWTVQQTVFVYVILNPCMLTQTIAIASILIVIRVGLGVNDSESNTLGFDFKTPELDIVERGVSNAAIQPFRLKYEHRQHPESSHHSTEDNTTLSTV
ncbi:hypothetical protein GYMLUDRAFT_62951 [Collybiopsis luxurians FD-317 M1]|uniref:Uncharacterized protein n=1 Tax=Collybiopsis luxurians FD-317 M1 TaxID=944289 RepID=A0A0D0BY20_9AGAR|nr:hypothetical protein GYMLUDRAFT_62951 [Collybiopsis luxurians FD-317 M1]